MFCTNRACLLLPLLVLLGACAGPAPQEVAPQAEASTAADAITLATEPQTPGAKDIELYARGLGYLRANQYTEAESAFTTLMSTRPELAGPYANMGLLYIKRNQQDKATEMLNKALEKNPRMAHAQQLLGYIETRNSNFLKARDHYLQAIEYKPDYAVAHYNLALLYDVYLRDIPKAVEHYKRYLELTNNQDKRTADWVNELSNSLKKG
jgi:tetratricopeptide (TPR) repeat protein